MVVPAEAHVTFPGDLDDGKAHVPIDQVLSMIMVTTNLTRAKLRGDWTSLADIPAYAEMADDHPSLRTKPEVKPHPWPLRYIVGAQSEPIESLKSEWEDSVNSGCGPVPQLVITLDSGFLYSGATGWPRPMFPTNYTEANEVMVQTGIYAGLGLAWLLTQHQGRLAAIQRRTIGPIIRQAKQLDTAMLSSATPATYSRRFETMFRRREIKGVLKWGGASRFAHNKLSLQTVTGIDDLPYCDPGINPTKGTVEGVRWFHYGMNAIAGDCVALEEWIPPKELGKWRRRIAVFNTTTGMEITGRAVEGMKRVSDVEKLEI